MNVFFINKYIILVSFLLICYNLKGQERIFPLGAERDIAAYEKTPERFVTKGESNIPTAHSLKKYCPPVGNQENQYSCVGWAVCYAAMSIMKNIYYNMPPSEETAYSPSFVYNQVKLNSSDCSKGAIVTEVLSNLLAKGTLLFQDYKHICENQSAIPAEVYTKAKYNRLEAYEKISFSHIKESIASNTPIVAVIKTYHSFQIPKSDYWNGEHDSFIGYHALTIIGYDDTKQAFQLMNSWGKTWGDDGFIWIKYSDFKNIIEELYAVYPKFKSYIRGSVSIGIRVIKNDKAIMKDAEIKDNVIFIPEHFDIEDKFDLTIFVENDAYIYGVYFNNNDKKLYSFYPIVKNKLYNPFIAAEGKLSISGKFTQKEEEQFAILISEKPIRDWQDFIQSCNNNHGDNIDETIRIKKLEDNEIFVSLNRGEDEIKSQINLDNDRIALIILVLNSKK